MDINSNPVISTVPNTTLQFTDDTLIIMDAHPHTLTSTMEVLKTYAQITRLQINLHKSEFIPITVPWELHSTIG
jgi:hypothetical protein